MKWHGGDGWVDDGCSCSRLFEQLVVGFVMSQGCNLYMSLTSCFVAFVCAHLISRGRRIYLCMNEIGCFCLVLDVYLLFACPVDTVSSPA